jgi:hypothetical protein
MAYTVSPRLLSERLEVLRAHQRAGLLPRKFRALGTLPLGHAALSVRYCATLWETSPQPAALTLRLLAEAGEITLVREGKRGRPGVPAVYCVLPRQTPKDQEYK